MTRRVARPLLYLGTVAIVLGLAKVHARFIGHYSIHATDPAQLAWTLTYLVILAVASYGAGLPELPRTARQAATSSVLAPAAAAGCISVVQLVAGDALLPRFVLFASALVLVPWNLVCVLLARSARSQSEQRDRVVVVASRNEATLLRDELAHEPERPAVLVATLEVSEALPVGLRSKPLCERVLHAGGTVVVLDRAALEQPAVVSQAAALHEAGIRVRPLRLFYEGWLGKLPVSELERTSLFFDIREVHGGRYARVKRVADVFVGAAGLLALALVTPLLVAGNVVGNRGPLLFRQQRIGKNGRPFQILKFRTMSTSAVDATGDWTAENDPRVTPFGRFLRRTHVDELPQAINILRGDLSVVGPRPEQPRYVEELTDKLPFYGLRHLVRPGLTGWAQVKYGYAGDERDALEKLQYEFWYLQHQRLGIDARIVGRTIRSVVGRGGR